MKKISFFYLLVAGFSFNFSFGQNQYSFLLHKTYAQRFIQLDSLFYNNDQKFKDSASFFNAADELASFAKKEGDNDLYLEAQFIKWRFYPYSNLRSDYSYLETKLKSLLKEAEGKNMLPLQIRITENLALYYYKLPRYGEAIEQYLNAYYLLKNISLQEFPNKRDFVYSDLGAIYFNLDDYDNAKKFLQEADTLPIFAMPRFNKIRSVINTTNTLGLIYRNTSRWDSAQHYFLKARNLAVKEKDTIWVGIAGGNIGITYFLKKKYAEAIPLLEEDIQLSIKGGEYRNAANSLIKLAEISIIYKDRVKHGGNFSRQGS